MGYGRGDRGGGRGARLRGYSNGTTHCTRQRVGDAGYDVNVDRVGSAPYEDCIVTSVRNPQDITRTFWVGKGKDRERVTVVVRRTITISLNCDV